MAHPLDIKNKSLSLRKSVNKTSHGLQNVQFQMPARNPKIKSSSPLSNWKSKYSRSKRFHDPHDIPPVSWIDLLLLIPYYITLYAFFGAFWFAMWYIYLETTDKEKPRHLHVEHRNLNITNAELLKSLINPSCNNSI